MNGIRVVMELPGLLPKWGRQTQMQQRCVLSVYCSLRQRKDKPYLASTCMPISRSFQMEKATLLVEQVGSVICAAHQGKAEYQNFTISLASKTAHSWV